MKCHMTFCMLKTVVFYIVTSLEGVVQLFLNRFLHKRLTRMLNKRNMILKEEISCLNLDYNNFGVYSTLVLYDYKRLIFMYLHYWIS